MRISIFGCISRFDDKSISIDASKFISRIGSHIACTIDLTQAGFWFSDERDMSPDAAQDFTESFDSIVGIVLPDGIVFEIVAAKADGQLMKHVFRK